MKYYIIEEIVDYGSQAAKPLCVVEKEEIAKDLVKRYNDLRYFECDTEENKDKQEKIIGPYIIDREWFKHIHWRHPSYGCINFEEFFILDDNDEIITSIKLFPNETEDGRFYLVDKERYETVKKYYRRENKL